MLDDFYDYEVPQWMMDAASLPDWLLEIRGDDQWHCVRLKNKNMSIAVFIDSVHVSLSVFYKEISTVPVQSFLNDSCCSFYFTLN
jgi:hypothetical protein